jgi:hypothetical protein
LKYKIQLKFKEHIKIVKIKVNELLTIGFCNQVKNNIIQSNSDSIPILEDIIQFKSLLKPKIVEILSGFDSTINDIYDMMLNNMISIIEESFGYFKPLERKVKNLYKNYSLEQKTKMTNFYNEIVFLETENISTFNSDINNKVNTMNKEINFFLFGNIKPEKRKCFEAGLKEVKNIVKSELFKFNTFSIISKVSEVVINCINKDEDDEKDDEKKIENSNSVISTTKDIMQSNKNDTKKKDRASFDDNDQVLNSIIELNNEIENNEKYDGKVKKKYKKYSELTQHLIEINYNYEKEKDTRRYDNDEFEGRIKIAYRPQDIGTYDERIIDEEVLKIEKDAAIIFIPGFRYI